jgi:uncharacterized protein YcbX
MLPYVSSLRVYPIKSLDPVHLQVATIGTRSLRFDREFALITEEGRYLNGKRTGKVNQLEAHYALEEYRVRFSLRGSDSLGSFHLVHQKEEIEQCLGTFFGMPVFLRRNQEGRLLDVPDTSSVTVVSEATLASLREAMPAIGLEQMRLRFRANIEIAGVPPYWEEHLFGEPGRGVLFQAGEVTLLGMRPRARCNVPPRDPLTGETDKEFVKKMVSSRQEKLPTWSRLESFGGYYHLAVDTFIPDTERGKRIWLGDPIKILAPVELPS